MKIADSHIHARFSQYEDICKMLDSIADVGVTDGILLSLPYHGAAENLAALYTKMHYKRINMWAFGGLHSTDRYADIPCEVQAETLLDMGCDGFKLMFSPDMVRYYGKGLDHESYEKMFALLEKRQVPVNIHSGDPEYFWDDGGVYADSSFPSPQLLYQQAFRMLDRHPNLKVVFAHFFFLDNDPEEAVRVMETYPNLRLDLTPHCDMYVDFDKDIDFWHDFFTKYRKRILFGTDVNTQKSHINQQLETLVYRKLTESKHFFTQLCYDREYVIRGLDLAEDVVKDICCNNFFTFVGEKKPVDEETFYRCCERVLGDIAEDPYDIHYIRGGEVITHLKDDPMQTLPAKFCRYALEHR